MCVGEHLARFFVFFVRSIKGSQSPERWGVVELRSFIYYTDLNPPPPLPYYDNIVISAFTSSLSSLCVLSDECPLQTPSLELCNCAVTSSSPTSNQIDFSSAVPSPIEPIFPFILHPFTFAPQKAHSSPSSNTIHSQIEPSFCPDSTHLQASSQLVIGIVKVPARAPGGLMGTDGMIVACITCALRSVF